MPKTIIRKRKAIEIEGVGKIRFLSKINRWELDAGKKLNGTLKYRRQFKELSEAKHHAELLKVKLKPPITFLGPNLSRYNFLLLISNPMSYVPFWTKSISSTLSRVPRIKLPLAIYLGSKDNVKCII